MRPTIGGREAMAITFFYAVSSFFLTTPRDVADHVGQSGWMAVAVSGLLTAGVFALVAVALVAMPEGGLVAALRRGLGPFIAGPLAILVGGIVLMKGATFLREFAGETSITVLPATPEMVLVFLLAVVGTYAAMTGVEGIGRAAWLAMPWVAGGTVLLCLLSLRVTMLHNLLPLWGDGPRAILTTGARNSGMLADVVLLVLAFQVRPQRALIAAGIKGYLLATILGVVVQTTTTIDFGVLSLAHEAFPLYQLARLVSIGRFFERLEAIFVFVWLLVSLFRLSLDVYLSACVFARLCDLPTSSVMVPVTSAVIFAGAVALPSWNAAFHFQAQVLEPHAWVLQAYSGGIALAAFAVWRLRRRGGARAHRGRGREAMAGDG